MRAWIVTALVLLGGCVDASDGSDVARADDETPGGSGNGTAMPPIAAPADSGASEQIPWELRDCFFMYSNVAADPAAVQASLPDGFTVQTGTGGRVGVGFETNVCASGSGLNGTVEPQTYGTVWIGVAPPAGLAAEAGAFHVMNLEALVEDEPRRRWLQERGIPARDGQIEVTDLPPGHIIEMNLGASTFTFTIAQLQSIANSGGTFDQWTPGDQGLTYWRTDWATTEQFQGVGTVQIDPNSVYASWFESPTMPAQFNLGTWDYTNGRIVHPAP